MPLLFRLLVAVLIALLTRSARAADEVRFVEEAEARGIRFQHEDGHSGTKHFVETASGGAALVDLDGDGWLEALLINGAETPGRTLERAPRHQLFRNRGGQFEDVTAASGIAGGYGMGVCVGDVDADGRVDLMLTQYGADRLYRNLGDLRFEDIGPKAGVADPRWSTGCAFADIDSDGDLDLYVARYAQFRFDQSPFCGDRARQIRSYCNPSAFKGEVHSLYINDGRGRFKDEAASRGIHQGNEDRGFGVIAADLDGDRDTDFYVANDGSLNRLYRNDGKGRFEDQGLFSGAGLNARGLAEAGMGADVGDVDGDGRFDLLVTNFSMEANTLYRNLGALQFEDATARFGIAEASFRYVGWGLQFFDADNDGDLDYALVNGHPIDNIEQFESTLSYLQPKQVFRNDGGRFSEVKSSSLALPRAGRGLAAGDFNNDGRVDLLVNNSRGRAELLRNDGAVRHWIGFRLFGDKANPHAIGAVVSVESSGRRLSRLVQSGGGFLSQRDLRLHFGLGAANAVTYRVLWPDGRRSEGSTESLDRYVDLHAP